MESHPYQYRYSVTVSNRNNRQYTIKVGKKISDRYAMSFGYSPISRKSRMPPNSAVVAYADVNSLVNSFASLSYRASLVFHPTISHTQAKIGTPNTNPARSKCCWATTQTTFRLPSPGMSRYSTDIACEAASWAQTIAGRRTRAQKTLHPKRDEGFTVGTRDFSFSIMPWFFM